MIDTVKNSPEHMRQAVYDLARYKLQEQFTHADAKDIQRAQQALEKAIRGVEEFSRQEINLPPPPAPRLDDGSASARSLLAPDADPPPDRRDGRLFRSIQRRQSTPGLRVRRGRSASEPPLCSSLSARSRWPSSKASGWHPACSLYRTTNAS
jgi:hypothetical protein